ncbi:NADPH-dependent F420 reductase [Niabella aurantiaca]|uniref:NADPH-dependent F420 reductase n=1 Tax=Niabella aurantiaca TaxID=379900 RepID=UPI000379D413|nr:NAD(P)-binding domain-containing protein [Niabella aurantiaca]
MKITIIGAGNIGSTLARNWAKAGHQIFLGVRKVDGFKEKELLSEGNISIDTIPGAIAKGSVIVLSVPPDAVPSLVKHLEGAKDKIIIDPTNAFRAKPEGFENAFDALRSLTRCKHIVKAFNNTGFENIANPAGLDTFVSGDSEKAKKVVKQLAKDLGFANCYDFGGNDKAALQEQLGMCWINLALVQGMGRDIAINVIKRQPL